MKYSGGGDNNIEDDIEEKHVVIGTVGKIKMKARKVGGSEAPSKSKHSKQSKSSQHQMDRFFHNTEGPQTFKFLAPRDTVCASVNVLGIHRSFRTYLDLPPYTFSSRLDLCRDEGPTYKICIIPAKEVTPAFRNLNELTSVVKRKKNCIFASFKNERDEFWIHVEFRYSVNFQYFFKMMTEIVKISEKAEKEIETPTEIRGSYHRRDVSTYRVPVKKSKSIVTGISKGIIAPSILGDRGGNLRHQFFEISAEDWLPPHFEHFLKHIFVQAKGHRRVMTLYEYMESVDPKMYPDLLSYFQLGGTGGSDEENDETPMVSGNYSSLRREIDNYEKDEKSCNTLLQGVFCEKLVRETLKAECNKLRCQLGLFDINFFLVLRKRVNQLKNGIEDGSHTLRRIIDDLNTVHRYWWNVEDCRDHILSLLLYRKSFIRFAQLKEIEFFKLEKKTFEDKVAAVGDVTWDSDKKFVLIDPDEWLEMLNGFNYKICIRMEDISFRVRIAYEQNELRMKLKQLEDVKRIEKLEDQLTEYTSRLMLHNQKYEKVDNNIMDLMGDESEEAKKKTELLEERGKKIEMMIGTLTNKKGDLEREIRKLKSQKNEKEIKKLKRQIKFRQPVNFRKRFLPFYTTEKRRETIRKHFLEHIDYLSGKGMSEFGVKLVISILKDHKVEPWQAKILSVVDKFYTPSFYKWGFIHANCQIANVGCHWFSSSLVVMTDLAVGKNYEELVAIDCCCPLIVNYHTIFDRLTSLAELIVASNVNFNYSVANVAGHKEGFMNCQEFANKLIKALDYTPFFGTVKHYLEELRNELTKAEKQDPENLRFLIVTEAFSKIYGKAWSGRALRTRFTPDKKRRIYFNSHDDVDTFFKACIEISEENGTECMDLKFPGEFQLLKGFDRAFWMKSKGGKNQKTDCPFLEIHSKEGEMNKKAEKRKLMKDVFFDLQQKIDGENEEEEEEEDEGEGDD